MFVVRRADPTLSAGQARPLPGGRSEVVRRIIAMSGAAAAALCLSATPGWASAPAAGQTQGLTVSTTRGAGYSTEITGLRLYVPLTFTYGTSPGMGWTMAMQWSGDPGNVVLA